MKLSFWINAFIPESVPDYTIRITEGKHANKTAIPLPNVARILNPGKDWSCGFLTDQRGFSALEHTSVRMQSRAEFDLSNARKPTFNRLPQSWHHRTSGTTEVDTETGEELGFAYSDMSRCSFTVESAEIGSISCKLEAKAGDPLVTAAVTVP